MDLGQEPELLLLDGQGWEIAVKVNGQQFANPRSADAQSLLGLLDVLATGDRAIMTIDDWPIEVKTVQLDFKSRSVIIFAYDISGVSR